VRCFLTNERVVMKKVLIVIMSGCFVASAQGMDGERIKKNLYKVLGIAKSATLREIKKSYYKLARKHHPDKNKHVTCAEKMKTINKAYAVLKDPDKRKRYDVNMVYGSFLDDVMDDFGDTYDEKKDPDYEYSDNEMEDDHVMDDADSDNDSFDEELYQREGARLMGQWKEFYHKTVHGDDDDEYESEELDFKPVSKKRLSDINLDRRFS